MKLVTHKIKTAGKVVAEANIPAFDNLADVIKHLDDSTITSLVNRQLKTDRINEARYVLDGKIERSQSSEFEG